MGDDVTLGPIPKSELSSPRAQPAQLHSRPADLGASFGRQLFREKSRGKLAALIIGPVIQRQNSPDKTQRRGNPLGGA